MHIAAALALVIAAAALDFLGKLLFPRIIVAQPRGMTPDKSSMWGLNALLANINQYALMPQPAIATSGTAVALSGSQFTAGVVLLTAGASGAFTINLASTAAIIAALGPTIPMDGTYGEPIFVQNNGIGQTGTITAGDAGTTLSGTMTIASNTTRVFLLTVLSPTTISLTNVGSLTL
jgi:hypothetical protein